MGGTAGAASRRRHRLLTSPLSLYPPLNNRWANSSWFAASGGLQEAAQSAMPQPHTITPGAKPAEGGLMAVGGAKAQSRFNGRTAIPIATVKPLSSSSGTAVAEEAAAAAAHPAPSSMQQRVAKQPAAALAAAAAARHAAAWGCGGQFAVGRTVDGSVPARSSDAPSTGEHASRWVFDTRNWRWALKGQLGLDQPAASDKHLLAARRWGDGRDALGATIAGQPHQLATVGSGAPAASTAAAEAAAAPAKRPRLRISAMTGSSSDEGFAAVGGLARQKAVLLEQVAVPLAHPRLFARLGVPAARGVLLHGPPGAGKTHLVRALAAEARLPIVVVNGGECVGEHAERNLRRAFQQGARLVAETWVGWG